ncbi:MAG: hypothetical protein WB444_03590 [Gallionella sp.]
MSKTWKAQMKEAAHKGVKNIRGIGWVSLDEILESAKTNKYIAADPEVLKFLTVIAEAVDDMCTWQGRTSKEAMELIPNTVAHNRRPDTKHRREFISIVQQLNKKLTKKPSTVKGWLAHEELSQWLVRVREQGRIYESRTLGKWIKVGAPDALRRGGQRKRIALIT